MGYIKSDYIPPNNKVILSLVLLLLFAPFYALVQSAPWITDGIMGAFITGAILTYLFPSMTFGWKIIRSILIAANQRFEQEINIEEFSQNTNQEIAKKAFNSLSKLIDTKKTEDVKIRRGEDE